MGLVEWFNGLAPRERLLVSVAAVLAAVAIVVVGAIRPMVVYGRDSAAELDEKRAVLADIERVAARFGPQVRGAGAAASPGDESLVVLIDRTTRTSGLAPYLKRNEPDGNTSIRLRFENAPFDELIGWLAALQEREAISVVAATADPGQDAGRVTANLQLSRAGVR